MVCDPTRKCIVKCSNYRSDNTPTVLYWMNLPKIFVTSYSVYKVKGIIIIQSSRTKGNTFVLPEKVSLPVHTHLLYTVTYYHSVPDKVLIFHSRPTVEERTSKPLCMFLLSCVILKRRTYKVSCMLRGTTFRLNGLTVNRELTDLRRRVIGFRTYFTM